MESTPKLPVSDGQYQALKAVCDALIPALPTPEGGDPAFWSTKASDLEVPDRILEVIALQNPADQAEFQKLLSLFENGFVMGFLGGGFKKFRSQPRERQEKTLLKWSDSRLGKLRKAFGTLRKLTCFLHYGSTPNSGGSPNSILPTNPMWSAMDYAGPLNVPPGDKPKIRTLILDREQELTCQTVVIGSGAGGGLAAGMLAEAGEDVIIVDKGPFMAGADFTMQEAEMIARTYDRGGTMSSEDGSTTVFAGSCLGGGTTINWTGSFPTPEHVLDEWDREHGLGFVNGKTYRDGVDTVMEAFSVNGDNSPHNFQNEALVRGSKKIGQEVSVILRNVQGCQVDGCKSCGYCGMGCRRGAKQGTLRTWIQRAVDKGARVMVETEAQKIVVEGGKAVGVEVAQKMSDGTLKKIRIKADQVVVAAGSVQTPALLLRSGLSHPKLGHNLFLHPVLGVPAQYEESVYPWFGTMMSAVNKTGLRADGNYGFWIETPPIHAGLAALALPWKGGLQHKKDMLRGAKMASFIVLVRDKFGGKVTVDKFGNPQVHYQLNPYDLKHMMLGLRDAFKIHRAAGAQEILLPHNHRATYSPGKTKISMEAFLDQMPRMGWKANQFNLFTAHQMGTCGMGKHELMHPVTPEGRFRGVDNLIIADGSAMPSSAGINPMISIMAMTHHTIAGLIK